MTIDGSASVPGRTVPLADEGGSWSRGDWLQTYTGRRFYPLDPQPGEIDRLDIGHALSLLCRYGGHVDRFYSVAEHSVLMSRTLAPSGRTAALQALLHDATEAYIVDLPRPLKRLEPLAGYRSIESSVWAAIAQAFGVPVVLEAAVKEADNRILLTERDALMPRAERWMVDEDFAPLPVRIEAWRPELAEIEWQARLWELTTGYDGRPIP